MRASPCGPGQQRASWGCYLLRSSSWLPGCGKMLGSFAAALGPNQQMQWINKPFHVNLICCGPNSRAFMKTITFKERATIWEFSPGRSYTAIQLSVKGQQQIPWHFQKDCLKTDKLNQCNNTDKESFNVLFSCNNFRLWLLALFTANFGSNEVYQSIRSAFNKNVWLNSGVLSQRSTKLKMNKVATVAARSLD